MYWFAATQQTSIAKEHIFLQNFLKRVMWLRVNENKITPENVFNGNYLGNGSHT